MLVTTATTEMEITEETLGDRVTTKRADGAVSVRLRGKAAVERLPDGPVDEGEQERLVEEFQKQQQTQEFMFSSLLVIVSFPLFLFFVCHAHWHLVDPW